MLLKVFFMFDYFIIIDYYLNDSSMSKIERKSFSFELLIFMTFQSYNFIAYEGNGFNLVKKKMKSPVMRQVGKMPD